eukprot:15434981-Alexandrium_andersonii.AAC.1
MNLAVRRTPKTNRISLRCRKGFSPLLPGERIFWDRTKKGRRARSAWPRLPFCARSQNRGVAWGRG